MRIRCGLRRGSRNTERLLAVVLLSFVWACSSSPPKADEPVGASIVESPQPEPSTAIAESSQPSAPAIVAASPQSADAGQPSEADDSNSENVVEEKPASDEPPVAEKWPPPNLRPSKVWPFYKWDSARAVTYNLTPFGRAKSIFAWTPKNGLNAKLVAGPELTKKQANSALKLLRPTLGGMEVSKCAFPRHGIVFYDGETPVGSINVCFECGDILISPAYKQDRNWSARKYKMSGKLMKAYDRVFPKWKKFFGGELGLDLDWKKLIEKQSP